MGAKRIFILAALVFASLTTFANEFKAKVVVQNVTLYRGIRFSDVGAPAVAGGITWEHASGLTLGTYMSNLNGNYNGEFSETWTQEMMHWLSYKFTAMEDWNFEAMVYRYYFPRLGDANSTEFRFLFANGNFSGFVSHMLEYFWGMGYDVRSKDKPSNTYVNFDYQIPVHEKTYIVPHVGYTFFSDEKQANFENYVDYWIAVRHVSDDGFMADLGWSDTMRKAFVAPATSEETTRVKTDGTFFFRVTKTF